MSSFGDFISLSDKCDLATAKLVKREVSDGIIAPDYDDDALELLKAKKNGNYAVVKIDPYYVPAAIEKKQVFGVTFEQGHNNIVIGEEMLENIVTENKELPQSAKIDLIISLITLKYTQSNSVCYVKGGQAIGIGAGQMSRVMSAKIAALKAEEAGLPVVGAVMASDAFFPFRDGIDAAAEAGIKAVIQPGGSMRDNEVIAAADEHGLAMVFTGVRHFRH